MLWLERFKCSNAELCLGEALIGAPKDNDFKYLRCLFLPKANPNLRLPKPAGLARFSKKLPWPDRKFAASHSIYAYFGSSLLSVQVSTPYSPFPTLLELTNVHHQFFDGLAICSPELDQRQRRGFIFGRSREYVILLLGIKVGCHPIFACFNLVRRIHLQLIDCSTPYRRPTQELKSSRVEIKMLPPCILARVE
jgi:hypothetical protein